MKLITSEMDAETDRWQQEGAQQGNQGGQGGQGQAMEHENNDIVKRAKNMSSMAFRWVQNSWLKSRTTIIFMGD